MVLELLFYEGWGRKRVELEKKNLNNVKKIRTKVEANKTIVEERKRREEYWENEK